MNLPIVIDTCTWIWLVSGNPRLAKSPNVFKDRPLLLSPISVWELALLVKKGRIELSQSVKQWVHKALVEPAQISLAPLIPDIAIASCHLKNYNHSDPADRIIIATALHHKTALVTGDQHIIDYGKKGHLKVIAV